MHWPSQGFLFSRSLVPARTLPFPPASWVYHLYHITCPRFASGCSWPLHVSVSSLAQEQCLLIELCQRGLGDSTVPPRVIAGDTEAQGRERLVYVRQCQAPASSGSLTSASFCTSPAARPWPRHLRWVPSPLPVQQGPCMPWLAASHAISGAQ